MVCVPNFPETQVKESLNFNLSLFNFTIYWIYIYCNLSQTYLKDKTSQAHHSPNKATIKNDFCRPYQPGFGYTVIFTISSPTCSLRWPCCTACCLSTAGPISITKLPANFKENWFVTSIGANSHCLRSLRDFDDVGRCNWAAPSPRNLKNSSSHCPTKCGGHKIKVAGL